MSYCKKYKISPTVVRCLACEECYPPAERVNGRMCGYEVEFDTLSAQAAVKGMDVPENLAIVPKAEGRKRLTDEQFEKLLKHAKEFARSAVWGRARELECDSELRDYLQEYLIEPFIEPLINGEL